MKNRTNRLKVEHNISRLNYLLQLYRITESELIERASEGLKTPLTRKDIYAHEINLNHLKRIDKVFNKGITFYLDPKPLKENKEASIFFRKTKFYSDLNFGAKKIVNDFEELKISLSTIATLSDLKFERNIPMFDVSDNPKKVAKVLRDRLYPDEFTNKLRDFLKALINKFAENNIFVFEFIETWNKRDVANIDGFFLEPNVIVLKRQQRSFRREIFTLIHELGHYLLNEEEVEQVEYNISSKGHNKIENWCNEFAFFFLAGKNADELKRIEYVNSENDYENNLIEKISSETNLSALAIYTRLLFQNKISSLDYNKVKLNFEERFRQKQEEDKAKKEKEIEMGIKQRGSVPKPINSPLFVSTLQSAFYDGVINEYDLCKNLNIKPEKLNQFI